MHSLNWLLLVMLGRESVEEAAVGLLDVCAWFRSERDVILARFGLCLQEHGHEALPHRRTLKRCLPAQNTV